MDLIDILLEKFSKNMMLKNKGVAVSRNRSFESKAEIIKSFHRDKKVYGRELNKNLELLRTGDVTKDEYLALQRDSITKHFRSAYLAGKQFSQEDESTLKPDEIGSIGYQVGKEMAFMGKFADDVINKTGKMDYSRRMKMYEDGLIPLFVFGQMVYLPEGVKIFWVLGDTDKHCVDCLSLASNSPYEKKTLPTVPKAGDSRCLSNCRCALQFPDIGPNDDYVYYLMDKYTERGENIPEPMHVTNLQTLTVGYYFHRGMAHITDGELSDYHSEIAKSTKEEFLQIISDNDFAIKTELPLSQYLSELEMFSKHENFELVTSTVGLEGKIVSVHRAGMQFYGLAEVVDAQTIRVKTLYNQIVTVNVVSGGIVFKDRTS